jgi:predicted dehydrogenase
MHTLVIVNPGHFHAGLVLREMHPAISPDVYIYSEPGSDLDNFMKLANAFNQREKNPTSWVFHLYAGSDYLVRAIAEKKGDVAILAGRNDRKIDDIKALHHAGFKVLSDKPLTIDDRGVGVLKEVLSGGEVLMDIMTERHEITSLIQRALMHDAAVFGKLRVVGGVPAIEKESVHYFCKKVNNAPLVRPVWYMDASKQGEGIVDVTTHLADLVQWMVFADAKLDFDRDVKIVVARTWETLMPEAKFKELTRSEGFPAELRKNVTDGVLAVRSNGEFVYELRGIPVRLSVIWDLEAAPGGGDTHYSIIRGTKADLVVEQGPATGGKPELFVIPAAGTATDELEKALTAALKAIGRPGLACRRDGAKFRIDIPAEARTTHEMHFAAVRDEFLRMVDGGAEPENMRGNLLTKYATLAAARDFAARS